MRGRKDVRLKNYDYTKDGYYFITTVTKLRQNEFLGREKLIENELLDCISKCPGIKLDHYVIMPNHVHFICILNNSALHVGEVVRRFKAKVSHTLKNNMWQWNYYEHVIRNEDALNKIRQYIVNNPQEYLLQFDQFYH